MHTYSLLPLGRALARRPAAAVAVALLGSCGGDATRPEPPRAPARVTVAAGGDQSGTVGTPLSSFLTVEVTDSVGRTLPGVVVGFQVVTGGGRVTPFLVTTGADGRASTSWTLGTGAGRQSVVASVVGIEASAVFTATARPGPPARLVALGGGGQTGAVGAALPVPLSVRVADAFGNPVGAVAVTFAITAGGGSISPTSPVTDSAGKASTRLTLGGEPGANIVAANVSGADPLTFSAMAIAADQQRIAYVSNREGCCDIWLINTDGTGITHLTNLRTWEGNPAWSPDGSRLVFEYAPVTNTELYVITRDGTVRERLTFTTADERHPAWSPDGSRIAFAAQGGIYVMNSDGTGRHLVISGMVEAPAWSPDGTRLAFTRCYECGPGTGNTEIAVANVDGSGELRLTTNPLDDTEPAWSPDGSRIAFSSRRTGPAGPLHLWLMNADGSDQHGVTTSTNLYNVVSASWAPDGSRVAFAGALEGPSQVWTIRPDGTGLTQLTNELYGAGGAAWSPR